MIADEAIKVFDSLIAMEGISLFYQPGEKVRGLRISEIKEASKMAIAAIRAQQAAEKNEPLTMEELRGMDGEPVYLAASGQYGEWALVRILPTAEVSFRLRNGLLSPGKIALESGIKIYSHKPEE